MDADTVERKVVEPRLREILPELPFAIGPPPPAEAHHHLPGDRHAVNRHPGVMPEVCENALKFVGDLEGDQVIGLQEIDQLELEFLGRFVEDVPGGVDDDRLCPLLIRFCQEPESTRNHLQGMSMRRRGTREPEVALGGLVQRPVDGKPYRSGWPDRRLAGIAVEIRGRPRGSEPFHEVPAECALPPVGCSHHVGNSSGLIPKSFEDSGPFRLDADHDCT